MKFLLTIITIWFCVDCGSACSSNADCITAGYAEGFCAPSGGCKWCSGSDPASNYCAEGNCAVCSSAGQNCDHNEQCFSGNCVGGNCSDGTPSPTTAPTAVSSANSVFAKTFYLMIGSQVVWQFFR